MKNTVVKVNSLNGIEPNCSKEPKVSKAESNGSTIASCNADNTIPRTHVGMTGIAFYNW
jgi:hypothetical protein